MSASGNLRAILDAAARAGHEPVQPRDGLFKVEVRSWLYLELWGPNVPMQSDIPAGIDALIAILQEARAAMGGPARRPPSMETTAPPRKRRTRRWP